MNQAILSSGIIYFEDALMRYSDMCCYAEAYIISVEYILKPLGVSDICIQLIPCLHTNPIFSVS